MALDHAFDILATNRGTTLRGIKRWTNTLNLLRVPGTARPPPLARTRSASSTTCSGLWQMLAHLSLAALCLRLASCAAYPGKQLRQLRRRYTALVRGPKKTQSGTPWLQHRRWQRERAETRRLKIYLMMPFCRSCSISGRRLYVSSTMA